MNGRLAPTFPAELFEYWGKRDPIGLYESWLLQQSVPSTELESIEVKATRGSRSRDGRGPGRPGQTASSRVGAWKVYMPSNDNRKGKGMRAGWADYWNDRRRRSPRGPAGRLEAGDWRVTADADDAR